MKLIVTQELAQAIDIVVDAALKGAGLHALKAANIISAELQKAQALAVKEAEASEVKSVDDKA